MKRLRTKPLLFIVSFLILLTLALTLLFVPQALNIETILFALAAASLFILSLLNVPYRVCRTFPVAVFLPRDMDCCYVYYIPFS